MNDQFYYLQFETQKLEEIYSILRQYPLTKFEKKELTHEEYNEFWKQIFIQLEGIKLKEHRVLTNHLANISKVWNQVKVVQDPEGLDPFVQTIVEKVETHPLYNNHPISKNKLKIRNH